MVFLSAAACVLLGCAPSVSASGSLDILAQSASHASAIPPGAQRVGMLTLRVTNTGTSSAALRALTLYRQGPGAAEDIDGIYGMENGQRITAHTVAVARTGKVPLRFRPELTIAPGSTRTVDILADFSSLASPAAEHALVLRGAADVDAGDASVAVRYLASTPARTGGRATGTIAVEPLRLTQKIRYGQDRLVARFRLNVRAEEDQTLRRIVLTNEGSADPEDLQSLVLETSRGERLAGPVAMQASKGTKPTVTFVLSQPLLLQRGTSVNLNVRASVLGSVRRTIHLVIDETSDVTAERAILRR